MTQAQGSANTQEVGRVSIRPPQFIKEKPAIWFIQMEAQFATSGITQDLTKFYHAVQTLDALVLSEVSELITNPLEAGKYDALKARILAVFQDSEEKRLKTLLNQTELGNQRPSRLLKHMRGLAESKVSDELLKSLWMQRLPANTQTVLSTSEDSLKKLAMMADRIHDIVPTNIYSLDATPTPLTTPPWESQLCEVIKRLDRIETRKHSPSPHRQRCRACSKSRARSTSSESKYCWYHKRFGQEAKKCTSPCGWKSKKEEN